MNVCQRCNRLRGDDLGACTYVQVFDSAKVLVVLGAGGSDTSLLTAAHVQRVQACQVNERCIRELTLPGYVQMT